MNLLFIAQSNQHLRRPKMVSYTTIWSILLKTKIMRTLHWMIHTPPPHKWSKRRKTHHRYVKRPDHKRKFQNINVHLVKWILHAVDNNILQNIPIMWEDIEMPEDIYGPSFPYLQGKTVHHKVHNMEPITV